MSQVNPVGTGFVAGKYFHSLVNYNADIQRRVFACLYGLVLTRPLLSQRSLTLESNKPLPDARFMLFSWLGGSIFVQWLLLLFSSQL